MFSQNFKQKNKFIVIFRNYLRRSRHLKSESGRFPSSTFDENEVHYDEPNISKVTPKEILSFAWQICKGMAYLSEIKVIFSKIDQTIKDFFAT